MTVEAMTLPVACCPGCGALAADPAPKLAGPLSCPRCWLMFGYDPDEPAPVERVEIHVGQLWAPRPFAVRVRGMRDLRSPNEARPEEIRKVIGPLLGMDPAGSGGYYVVTDPPFAEVPKFYTWRMVNLDVPGVKGHMMAEPFLQQHYQLVAEVPA